eukprot:5262997-Amphidinium_carterae.1
MSKFCAGQSALIPCIASKKDAPTQLEREMDFSCLKHLKISIMIRADRVWFTCQSTTEYSRTGCCIGNSVELLPYPTQMLAGLKSVLNPQAEGRRASGN